MLLYVRFHNYETKLSAILDSIFLNELKGFQQTSFPAQEILSESPWHVCVMLTAFPFCALLKTNISYISLEVLSFSPQ
jgi:hypothetical protein